MARFEDKDSAEAGEPITVRRHTGVDQKPQDDDPWVLSPQREAMGEAWKLPTALMGGTAAMRAAGSEFLPKEPAEKKENYEVRLRRSFLFNAFKDTVNKLAGKPFTRDVALAQDTSDQIKAFEKDIDLRGRTLTQFAGDLLTDGWQYGLAHVFVEFPQNTPGRTLAEEQAAGLRPYLVKISPPDILGWRSAVVNGVEVLTQLRRRECSVEAAGPFGSRTVERVRVYDLVQTEPTEPGEQARMTVVWRLFERNDKNDPVQVGTGELTLDEIPLATLYVARTGFLTAEPPLEDLAYLNLAHWQSSSDQRNILRIARVGILFAAGVKEDFGTKTPIGATVLLTCEAEGAKLEWVEHSGAAIGAGRQDLLDLQEQMTLLGLEPLMHRPGGTTATEASIDTAKAHSKLRKSVRAEEQALERALQLMARWLEIAEPKIGVDINEDFGLSIRDASDVDRLITMRKNGDLTRESLWAELQRRNLLGESFDAAAEALSLSKERPAPVPPVPPQPGGGGPVT